MSSYVLQNGDDGREYFSFLFAGREIRLSKFPGTLLSVESLSQGLYEAPLPILLMAALARTKGVLCDVGANIGIYSVLATKTKEEISVYAFEPLASAREALVENLRVNGTSSKVEIMRIALSDSNCSALLYLPDAGHGLLETSASLEADFKAAAETISVSTRTLDGLMLPKQIDVIKADIEGHETAFIRGATRSLSEDRPFVFAEMLSGASKDFFKLSKLMADLEYLPFRMRPDAVVYTRLIVSDKGWNYAFIPSEKIGVFRDCCRAHDIELFQSY